jgi:hypothetical protein
MKLLHHIRSNAVAYAALFIALGGSSYAAVSINGSQIRNRTINPIKLNPDFIAGNVRGWANVRPNGQLIASAGHPRVQQNHGLPSEYIIRWGPRVSHCSTIASVDGADSPPTQQVAGPGNSSLTLRTGFAVASRSGSHYTLVDTYNQSGQPTQMAFNVAVIC